MCCVFLNKTTAYEWFVCGDDNAGKNMFSSVLATWAGIEYAASNGYERFDFMGAGKPGNEYGVREFKSKFGGELVEHGRFLYICNPLQFKSGKLIVSLLKNFAFQR
jgi:lipid II:glycine glycyltransferase (peptidoglycan interpeptide bridge formation enzyme)